MATAVEFYHKMILMTMTIPYYRAPKKGLIDSLKDHFWFIWLSIINVFVLNGQNNGLHVTMTHIMKQYKFLVIVHLVHSPCYLSETVDFAVVLRNAVDETSAYYRQAICSSLGNYDAANSNTDISYRSKQQGQSLHIELTCKESNIYKLFFFQILCA